MNDVAALTESIDRQIAGLDARTALYARHSATGQEIAIGADEPVNPLSTPRSPLWCAYRDADAGLF